MAERGAVEGLHAFVGWWRRILESSHFEAGCPVLAVAVEPVAADDTLEPGDGRSGEQLRVLARQAFERWEAILSAALRREGVSASRARRLGTLTVTSIEGTVAMCRVARSRWVTCSANSNSCSRAPSVHEAGACPLTVAFPHAQTQARRDRA